MHGEEAGFQRGHLPQEPHAVLVRDAADAGHLGIEGGIGRGKDRDRHLVHPEAQGAALGPVCRLKKLGFYRCGKILRRSHLRHPTLDPLGDACAVDGREAVRDDRVSRATKGVEHAGPGGLCVGSDIEDRGHARLVGALLDDEPSGTNPD